MNQQENNGPGNMAERPRQLTEQELERLRDMEWAATDPEVQRQYPDQVVAAFHRQIIAHGHEEQAVLEEAQRITGLPRHQVAITTILGPGILFSPR